MLKISKKYIQIYFILVILFIPLIITKLGIIDTIISLIYNVMLLVFFIIWLCNGGKFSRFMIIFAIYCGVFIFSTFLNNGNITEITIQMAKIWISCLLLEWSIKNEPEAFFSACRNLLGLLVVINLISMILFPNGLIQIYSNVNEWYQYSIAWWLFGNKNTMILWLFPANMLAQVNIIKKSSNNIFDYIIIISTIFTVIIGGSSTSLVVLLILSSGMVFRRVLYKLKNIFNMKMYIGIFIGLSIILYSSISIGILDGFTKILGKDATFTGRADAWNQAVNLIVEKPILGYGFKSAKEIRSMLGSYAFVNAHSTALQIMLDGGIILLSSSAIILLIISRKIKATLKYENGQLYVFAMLTLFALFIEISFEALNTTNKFWYLLVLIYYLSYYIKENDKRKRDN